MTIHEFVPNFSRKRKAILHITTSIHPTIGWSGGSCSYYCICQLPGANPQELRFGNHFNIKTETQELLPGNYVIETGVFCGKEATPRVHCREEDKDAVLALVSRPWTFLTARNSWPNK